jgi:hypothetical protein
LFREHLPKKKPQGNAENDSGDDLVFPAEYVFSSLEGGNDGCAGKEGAGNQRADCY